MKKRALLLLIGGRQVPNVLTAQYLRPDIIVPIASREAMHQGGDWDKVEPALRKICPEGLRPPLVVDAFAAADSYMACLGSLMEHRDAEWFVNITCGSKIMGFGVYDASLPMNLPMPVSIWYLDTATRRVVTLKGSPPESDLFSMTVAEYFGSYGRQVTVKSPTEAQVAFADLLARNPREAMTLAESARNAEDKGDHFRCFAPSKNLNRILKAARAAGFIDNFKIFNDRIRFRGTISSTECHLTTPKWELFCKFVNGTWLEVFAWWAASESGAFDDIQCGVEIQNQKVSNELDLAATSSASLLIAECKTGDQDFKKMRDGLHIEKLHSIADMIGGNFVHKVFITSRRTPSAEKSEFKHFVSFKEQAAARQVVVVTGENLLKLPEILRRESGARGNPSFYAM